jgi:glucuronokinase
LIIHTRSYPRAALVGNPSDGYHGKTIAFVFANFSAEIWLYETPELEILPYLRDTTVFTSMKHLVNDVRQYGYYGGFRLLKASIKKFYEHCEKDGIKLGESNFTIRYRSDIPNGLGLAGSSAIITACMRALMQFFNVQISNAVLANVVLSVETEELKIAAGLQDRVAQAYEMPVYMDFDKTYMEKHGYGRYETLGSGLFKNIYIAYRPEASEGSEIVHNDLRSRYNRGDEQVHAAMQEWAGLTEKVKEALLAGRPEEIGQYLDRNFDLRNSLLNVGRLNEEMIEIARSTGASAKFTGSGGAIIGTYEDEIMYQELKIKLEQKNIKALRPIIVNTNKV